LKGGVHVCAKSHAFSFSILLECQVLHNVSESIDNSSY